MAQSTHNQPLNLIDLVPAVYRIDDAAKQYPLRKLVEIISAQANLVKDDIAGLWDDFFIETCADWVIPYIGDLVGNRALHEGVVGRRADVAKTIYYRRRKGTLPMLEELARDVTGWGAHAVAFFEQLGWTQNLNHLRRSKDLFPCPFDPYASDRVGTTHVRSPDAVDLIDGPFDRTTHTVDVRPIGHREGRGPGGRGGWHNIPNVGFFLWRLAANPSILTMPRPSALNRHGYHFSPLGNPAPLFTRPRPELSETGLAEEIHVPGPIRPRAFMRDTPAYYGDERSVAVFLPTGPGGALDLIPASDVVCMNIDDEWERPPAGISGLFSANRAGFGGLVGAPKLNVSIGTQGPFEATLTLPANTLGAAATSLENAIRNVGAGRAFAGVRVLVIGNRLLVLPGLRGVPITFAAAASDPVTVAALGLDTTTPFRGLMSGNLSEFAGLTNTAFRRLSVRIGNITNVVDLLASTTLAAARTDLENKIQAIADPSFTGTAVQLVDDHLLIIPAQDGEAVVITGIPADAITVQELRLASRIGIDVVRGRLVFPIGLEPTPDDVRVNFQYGFSSNMGGGFYDRRRKPGAPEPFAFGHPDTVRFPTGLAALINVPPPFVPPGPHDHSTIAAAVADWNGAGLASAVLQVADSLTHAGNIAITLTGQQRLIVQAAQGHRPTLRGNIVINAVGGGCSLRLDGFWIEGRIEVNGSLKTLEIAHCRVVPGGGLTEAGEPANPNLVALTAHHTNDRLTTLIDHSILGPLVISRDGVELRIVDSIIDSPGRSAVAPVAAITGTANALSSQPAPNTTILRSTILGSTFVRELTLASETIFLEQAKAQRRQAGCIRFSYVPNTLGTPKRFRCQPDLALEGVTNTAQIALIKTRTRPGFTSIRSGDPGYAQLSLATERAITRGAENGSEMGAFCELMQPQREANLRIRLDEYLPLGLRPGLIFVS